MERWILMYEIESGAKQKALKVVIYGPEGVGKTTLASQFPNALFIDTEGSTTHYDVKRLKNGQAPSSWQELLSMIRWVKDMKPCSTLVIDTADWAARIAGKTVLAEHNKKGIEDFGYGNGYVYQLEKYGEMLDELTLVIESGINVVLTAHTEIVKFEDPGEMGAYDRWELNLLKRGNANMAGLTKEWANMVLFLNYKVISVKADERGNKFKGQGGQRVMYTEHRPAWDAKNRFGLPAEMPLDYSGIAHVIPDLNSGQAPSVESQIDEVNKIAAEQPQTVQNVASSQEMANQQAGQLANEPMTPEQNAALESIEGPSYFPDSLKDLMFANSVTEDEIRAVMGVRGHFPIDTPFENIAANTPEYFEGGLVANWEPVLQVIHDIRANPNQLVELYKKANDPNPEQTVANLNLNNK